MQKHTSTSFENVLLNLQEGGETYSKTKKKITFLDGAQDIAYGPLFGIFSSNNTKTYEDLNFALRKAVDVEDNHRGRCNLC